MIDLQRVVAKLSDPTISLGEKAAWWSDYLDQEARLAVSMGLGRRVGYQMAITKITEALPEEPNAKDRLRALVRELQGYAAEQRRVHTAQVHDVIARLRALPHGTSVVFRDGDQERIAVLLEARRTRFVCELADGRRVSVPADFVVRVHDGAGPTRLPDKQVAVRGLIRGLASGLYEEVRELLLAEGLGVLGVLLDELAAAHERIEEAPAGVHQGRLNLGMVRRINPRDQALVKRIPEVVVALAEVSDRVRVQEAVEAHPSPLVRQACGDQLEQKKPRRTSRKGAKSQDGENANGQAD